MLMKATGVDQHEVKKHRDFSFCCGAACGVRDNERAAPLRYRAMENKLREIDDTGAATFLTSSSDCRRTFDDALAHCLESEAAKPAGTDRELRPGIPIFFEHLIKHWLYPNRAVWRESQCSGSPGARQQPRSRRRASRTRRRSIRIEGRYRSALPQIDASGKVGRAHAVRHKSAVSRR